MPLDVSTASYPRNELQPSLEGFPHERYFAKLAASSTFIKGQIVQQGSTDGTFETYDASKTIHMVVPIACSTDASGNITIGTNAEHTSITRKGIDLWATGVFKATDLVKDNTGTAIDATALGKIGKLIVGSLAANGHVWVK